MCKSSILLIIFNRPKSTQKVFEAIKNAQPDRLYIAADAPRIGNATDILNCDTTKKITENIDWPCEVSRLYQEHNLGCSLGPRAAFKWFFSFEQEGIILEDDCLPNQSFFEFTNEMLDRFRNHKQIISINGSNLGYINGGNESYSYSKYMNMWGWATWADRAKKIDYSLDKWEQIKKPLWFLYRKMGQHLFDADIHW